MFAATVFKPVPWSVNTNIYEVNIRQYTPEGTLEAFGRHLPRLKEMGVETLWLMPLTPISEKIRQGTLGSYYACSSYTAINPEFGTVADLVALVQHAHTLGMKVLLDWVANHTGHDHEWTRTHPDFFEQDAAGNFTERNGWHDVIDLDYTNTALRVAMVQAMAWWVKTFDLDGFRCDMAHLVPLDFWQKARIFLDSIKPLYWLAETEDTPYHRVFDCSYAWQWMHTSVEMIINKASLAGFKKVLYYYNDNYPPQAQKLFFTTNHDENSWNGTEYEKYNGAALAMAVFTATWNGIPLVYSGQELPNYKRLKFFDKDEIAWGEKCTLHSFYKALLELRKSHPALKAGCIDTYNYILHTDNEQVFAFLRINGNRQVLVVLNFSPASLILPLPDFRLQGVFTDVFDGMDYNIGSLRKIAINEWGFRVLQR
ncbi:MAG: alpha-amylase family glycosyl hydrolase [Chitinophagaceae bacterium]|nr:alpha-amylase family glycosyl hydrolase [Chitinophagaceae bacterium]